MEEGELMRFLRLVSFTSGITFIIDLLLIWLLIYILLRVMRNNERAGQIFKGFLIIILARYLANWIGLKLVGRFLSEFINWGFLFVAIIFTPEIRSTLENVGKRTGFNQSLKLMNSEKSKLISELSDAVSVFSQTHTGALISIQMQDSLHEYATRGVMMNAETTKELLGNIFYPKTPLHDGAVIIEGDKITAASVFFPSTNSQVISTYGARHRAALAISELSDCITIIVSEETGEISIARFGMITKVDEKELTLYLNEQLSSDEQEKPSIFKNIFENSTSSKSVNKKHTKIEKLENGEVIQIYYRRYGGNKNEK